MALLSGLANAQIGTRVAPGFANSNLSCNALVGGTPQLRPEGYTELLGDIYITCTGGRVLDPGMLVPTTNITVYVTPNVPITSRIIGPNGASEAMLIIDDPGSGVPTGATGSYGPNAPQSLCTTAQQQNLGGSSCQPYVGTDTSGDYQVAVLSGTSTNAQNVYQGTVGDFGSNSVTFYAVPVLPPAWLGVSRTFRITNIRIPATGLAGTIQASLSTGTAQNLPLLFSQMDVGIVGPAMTARVDPAPTGGSSPFSQCSQPQGAMLTAHVSFTESFATAFKTRVVPLTNVPWASTVLNTGAPGQNIPGGLYNGFASNNESGFIMPTATANVAGIDYTAGLADFGTRLKAVFTNIPAGLSLYVSTTNASGYTAPGGTSATPYAVLVATSQSNEANNDGAMLTPLSGGTAGSDGLTAYPLIPDGTGTATAIWEVVNADPGAADSLTFSVYVGYSGQPAATGQLGQPSNNVALSLAPEPGGGTFSQANAATGLTSPVPRYMIAYSHQGPWVTINSCSLYVSNATVPFGYAIGGTAPPSKTVPVTINPSNLAVTVSPSVTTPASGTWLSASLSGGTLTISANPAGLAASATPYTGTVVLSAAGVTAFSIPVTLTVDPALAISPSTLALATMNWPYTSAVTATGGIASYSWSATGWPNGLTLNTSTGVISGTPAVAGSANVMVTVTDGNSATASQSYTLTVNPALLVYGPASLPSGVMGVAYPATTATATGGSGVYSWSATGLPAGLTLSTTGAIAGTPTAYSGSPFTVQLTVTDSNSVKANRSYALTVVPTVSISGPASLPVGTVNWAYAGATMSATGGNGFNTWSATGLPSGMGIGATTGAIGGTPVTNTGSPYRVQVTVTDSSGATDSANYSLTITGVLAVTAPSALPAGTVSVAYPAATVIAGGGISPYSFTATGLPAGLRISFATGGINGTPTTSAGSPFTVNVTVTDTIGATAHRSYTLAVNSPLSVSGPTSLPSGTVSVAYSATTPTADGVNGACTWWATGLPPGLTMDPSTGMIAGTPTSNTGSPYNVVLWVKDGTGATASRSYTLTINLAAVILPVIASISNTAGGQPVVAPNTWVSIYGSNFAPVGFTDDWSKSIVNGNLPTLLDGVRVTVDGQAAYVAYVSAGQINVLLPDVSIGSLQATVTTAAGTSAPFTINSQQDSPAFFPWPNGQPVATHLDYTKAAKNGTFPGTPTVAANPGEDIVLWCVGLGPTSPPAPSGVMIPAGTTYNTASAVVVTINGTPVPVYLGTAALAAGNAGLYQIGITVPASLPDGDYTLVASVNGAQTPPATLTIHN